MSAAPVPGMSFDIDKWVAAAAANVPADEVFAVDEMALRVARRFQTTPNLAMDTAFIEFARQLNGRQILAFMAKFLELLEKSKGGSYGEEDAQQILASTVSQEPVAQDGSEAAATALSGDAYNERVLEEGQAASLAAERTGTFLANQDTSSTLYKAAKYDYDNDNGNAVDDIDDDVIAAYATAKNANPAKYGAIQRALWDQQNALPFNEPDASTRPVVTPGAGDAGLHPGPPSVLKF